MQWQMIHTTDYNNNFGTKPDLGAGQAARLHFVLVKEKYFKIVKDNIMKYHQFFYFYRAQPICTLCVECLFFSTSNWKLICLHSHIIPDIVRNFVEAPLVTLGVNGMWNDDCVMYKLKICSNKLDWRSSDLLVFFVVFQ